MSKEADKKPGLFGRLFGGGGAAPHAETQGLADLPKASPGTVGNPADLQHSPPSDAALAGANAQDVPIGVPPFAQPFEQPAEQSSVKQGWFQRLRTGLAKTSAKLSDGITGVFTKRKLDNETLEELEDLLIQSDLGLETTERITVTLRNTRYDKTIAPEEVRQVLADEVERVLTPVAVPLAISGLHKPEVILFVGVNGTGKTTTIGKLAARFRAEGRSVLLAAGDTFRAAAIEQLAVWGQRTGVTVISRDVGSDAASLAFDAITEARRDKIDVLMIDTAGRLQNKKGLMEELEKVVRVLKKVDPAAPHQVLLVLDATTGQNAISQVEVFQQVAGVTGLVMTKLDGTARGGILVAISAKFKLPVVALGIGERVEDLQPFNAREFAQAIAQV